MTKWETKIVNFDISKSGENEDLLNLLGSDGWQIRAVLDYGGTHIVYLQRPITDHEIALAKRE